MYRQWKDYRTHWNFVPQHVAYAHLFGNDELKALVQFWGTTQRHFYTVTRFERGASTKLPGQFASLEEAKAAS
jgi:hypothetical protein